MTLIAMTRSVPMREGGPVTADVDAAQVDDWRKRGWEVAVVEEAQDAKPKLDIDIDGMTVNELRAFAKDHGVNIPAALKDRAKIVTALRPAIEVKHGPLA